MSDRFPSVGEDDPEIQKFERVHEHMTMFVVLTGLSLQQMSRTGFL
jgi:hypothetical protein